MPEEYQTIQIFQKVIDATIPIITTVIGAIIGGIATSKTAKWQTKRREKHEYVSKIAAMTLELQTTTASNFLFYEQNNPEKAIIKVCVAYETCLKTTSPLLSFVPKDVRKATEKYLKLTHHNITVWTGKYNKDPAHKDDRHNPHYDQTDDRGKAKKAFEELREALSEYASAD